MLGTRMLWEAWRGRGLGGVDGRERSRNTWMALRMTVPVPRPHATDLGVVVKRSSPMER